MRVQVQVLMRIRNVRLRYRIPGIVCLAINMNNDMQSHYIGAIRSTFHSLL